MTPEEWKDILFEQHINRLNSLLLSTTNDNSKNDTFKASKPKPVFTIITDDDSAGGASAGEEGRGVDDEIIRRLPISVDDALEDVNERRLLYLSFRHLLLSSLDTLEALAYGTRELIPAGARWFAETWMKYPLLDQRDFCFRMKIFGSIKRLYSTLSSMHPPPANRDVVKKHLKTVLALESAMDLTSTLLVDVEGWNKDGELLQMAWSIRNHDLMPPTDPEIEQNIVDEMDKNMEKQAQDLRNLPFHPPRMVDEERLVQYISEVRSRSDGYCLLFSLMESLAIRMVTTRRKNFIRRKSQGLSIMTGGLMSGGGAFKDEWSPGGKNMFQASGRGVQIDPDTAIAFAKLEWVATFVAQQTHASVPTPALCLSALKIVHRVTKQVDPENINMSWKEIAGELESRLEYSFSRQQANVKSGGIPPFASTRSQNQPFFIKLLQQKRKKEGDIGNAASSEFTSEDSLVKELSSVKNELEDVVASLEDMWFQVDPNADRIVVKPPSNVQERYSDETLISIQSGTLVLTRKELVWSSSRSFNGVGTGVDLEAGIRIAYGNILRFSYGRLDATPQSDRPGANGGQGGAGNASAGNPGGTSSNNLIDPNGAPISGNGGGSSSGNTSGILLDGDRSESFAAKRGRKQSGMSEMEGLPTIDGTSDRKASTALDSTTGSNGNSESTQNNPGSPSAETADNSSTTGSDTPSSTFPNIKQSFAKRMSLGIRFKNQPTRKKSYHLDIHTRDEVFKFFPFHGDEIHQMVRALSNISGLAPFKEEEFVQNVLCKKLEMTRRQALKYLLEEDHPWIEHSADLTAVIDALTSESQPQRIVDMERLFHSCRIEIEVTKEAIFLLRKIWHTTQSEHVKLKVLSVVDRLLDRVVMRQGDPNFSITFKWLKHLEETVSPYKSSEALKLIIHLVRRAKMIQIEPLSPLVRNQCHALFDTYNDHLFLQNFYDEAEEKNLLF
ncbi:hypothetical protein HDU97_000845 [Phlyctochytrium planicorne]|nr:hypothetical protein HDU97_000845 [Phlyctochytrium planicorne]